MKKFSIILVFSLLLSSCSTMDAINIGAGIITGGMENDSKPKKNKK